MVFDSSIVPRETMDKFEVYEKLLIKWQAKINIVSRGTINDLRSRHFLDSWQLTSIISNKDDKIVDLGSGAGFPGMILAIAGYTNVTLVEKNKKKTSFLRQVALATSTSVTIVNESIEHCSLYDTDIFVSRALASIKNLFTLISPFTNKETCCIFLKGKNACDELDQAKEEWTFNHTLSPSLTQDHSNIVIIRDIKSR